MTQQNPNPNPADINRQGGAPRPQDGPPSQGEERSFGQEEQRPEERQDDGRQDDGRQDRGPQIDRQDRGADDVERGAGPR